MCLCLCVCGRGTCNYLWRNSNWKPRAHKFWPCLRQSLDFTKLSIPYFFFFCELKQRKWKKKSFFVKFSKNTSNFFFFSQIFVCSDALFQLLTTFYVKSIYIYRERDFDAPLFFFFWPHWQAAMAQSLPLQLPTFI